ncbi:MAG: hypothetical protein MUE40_13210 [Anaerolineae bacterium]|nr:hypothetical protein [Anaerolineae bacterium]
MKARQKPGVVFAPQAAPALLRGVQTLVDAVRPTLGPLAGSVAIDHLNKTKALPEVLDSGGVIARRIIELGDRDADMGAMLLRGLLVRQHERIGDGTATTAVLFEAIFSAGLRYIAAGGNPMRLRRSLERLLPLLLKSLAELAQPLADQQPALTRLAYMLCQQADVAQVVGEAFALAGGFGRVEVRAGYGRELTRDYPEGSYFYSGLFSRTLATEGDYLTLETPAFFLCDFEIDDYHALFPVLQTAHAAGLPRLVIVARQLSEKAIALLVTNNRMGRLQTAAIKLPGLNAEDRQAALTDLAVLTGAQPWYAAAGTSLEGVQARHFGHARRAWADLHAFGLVNGRGDPRHLRQHVAALKARCLASDDPEVRRNLLQRLGTLAGRSVIVRVGGFTETEIHARKNLAEQTVAGVRAALLGGVVPGGGMALLHCRAALAARLPAVQDTDERAACRILSEALAAPAAAIYRNAGYDPGAVLAQLAGKNRALGFDVVAGRVVNLRAAGLLDSAITLQTCLRNAISTAALALTVDALIHLKQPEMTGKPE